MSFVFLIVSMYRQLINAARNRDDTIGLFEQCLNHLNSFPSVELVHKQVPHIEMRWIVSECWNNGVYYYKCGKHEKAEKWMSLSISLSRFVDKSDVELHNKIHNSYASVLKKIKG